MPCFLYILFCDQKTFYIGITKNLKSRFEEHRKGQSTYTKKFSDIRPVYKEEFADRKNVELREQQLKKWPVAKKKALIRKNAQLLKELSKSRALVDKRPE